MIGGITVICPVCVLDGVVVSVCHFMGVPDVITAFALGLLSTSMAYSLNKKLNNCRSWKKQPGQLLYLNVLCAALGLFAMKSLGLW